MSDSETEILELKTPPPEDLLKLIKKEKQVPAAMNIVAIPHDINELNKKDY